jgi:telomere length regulation protein
MVQDDVKQILDSFQSPIPDLETLLNLLARPLESIGLLQTRFQKHVSEELPKGSFSIPKHLPVIQRALLQSVLPSWDSTLREENALEIADQFLCPTPSSSQNAIRTALEAYTTILSIPFNTFSIRYLSQLTTSYHIPLLFRCVLDSNPLDVAAVRWEDCVRAVVSVPTKVANFCGTDHFIPRNLQYDPYVADLCSHTEGIVWRLSFPGSNSRGKFSQPSLGSPLDLIIERTQALSYLLAKLVNIGVFPSTSSSNSSQPSFFTVCLPEIRHHVESPSYQVVWKQIFDGLPSSAVLQSIFISLLSSIRSVPPLDSSPHIRSIIKSEATLLRALLGDLSPLNRDLWDIVSGVSQIRDFGEGRARVLACWVAFSAKDGAGSSGKP